MNWCNIWDAKLIMLWPIYRSRNYLICREKNLFCGFAAWSGKTKGSVRLVLRTKTFVPEWQNKKCRTRPWSPELSTFVVFILTQFLKQHFHLRGRSRTSQMRSLTSLPGRRKMDRLYPVRPYMRSHRPERRQVQAKFKFETGRPRSNFHAGTAELCVSCEKSCVQYSAVGAKLLVRTARS